MEEDRTLSRDVQATLIPQGDPYLLQKDSKVTITHRLGGNFTVMCEYGMFRIAAKDGDSLGEKVPDSVSEEKNDEHSPGDPPSDDKIWEKLSEVYDPEIPVNVVDLGLIYSMVIQPIVDKQSHHVEVAMTLTAPGCGMGPTIAEDARQKILAVPGIETVNVEIVWDPPWTQDMISETGKMELGLM